MSMVRELRDLMARISRVEQQVSKLPSRISSAVGGSGGSGSGIRIYEAPTKAELPEGVARSSFGLVNAGPQIGMMCIRNPANDGWDAFNVLE